VSVFQPNVLLQRRDATQVGRRTGAPTAGRSVAVAVAVAGIVRDEQAAILVPGVQLLSAASAGISSIIVFR